MTPEEAVRDYLRYVMRAGAWLESRGFPLNPKLHPSEAGLLKLVYARTPAEAEALKKAYRKLTGAAA